MSKANIHKSVVIEDGAKIASDVVIGHFCNIGKDVELKSGCRLESNVILKGKLTVDEDVKIFSFTAIGNEDSEIEIGTKTHIREFSQIGAQEADDGTNKKIIIGANNFLMGYVQILSGVEMGDFCILTNAVKLYENVKCQERVIVGGLSTVEANNTIGTGVMIGGASVVNHDIPPFTLVEGNTATVKGLNIIGLRRRLENKDDIEEIKAIYKKVLGDGVDKKLAREIADTHENEYVKKFTSFIANSNI
ncbi:MAG: acyl-ACP--UDP-N- acetylglucosamine O-acyltransferase [Sulfurimonas sp.]|uniref:acyl-ACP--UDP-N- acetylglucosamine O-acyltransferase n=1 Tax=Sulfurimonas sp. TaxID=2022749 RepID=UPI0026336F07|nr:acyl-ACP--UDP-N- acetylglucosamine O-acyltransferase [Sulfurimonas sp.]MCW8894974.1 acyl-ACP--UDP-N- acetylglucosamine O-acyltransferase [Sulfurimonas sp.]MCW8954410.1 acyl-ACP--UDP-N- acetylglucosamine O-acyltransferase [Sulfurimonas sp.]MCW9066870.1 acyl-ACP--UDP-N- acetylglucosamine O-acyltransferase [Sulfurimonas sp.]